MTTRPRPTPTRSCPGRPQASISCCGTGRLARPYDWTAILVSSTSGQRPVGSSGRSDRCGRPTRCGPGAPNAQPDERSTLVNQDGWEQVHVAEKALGIAARQSRHDDRGNRRSAVLWSSGNETTHGKPIVASRGARCVVLPIGTASLSSARVDSGRCRPFRSSSDQASCPAICLESARVVGSAQAGLTQQGASRGSDRGWSQHPVPLRGIT